MVSVLDSGSSCPGSGPGRGHCVVFLGKTLYSHGASLHPGVYSYFEKVCQVHATIPKGNMGYDQYTVSNDCSCRTYFCYFPSALANIYQWPPVRFF